MAAVTTAPLNAPNRTPEGATAVVKFHASLNVSDLDRSVAFYTALLGQGPAKHYGDYAKFELEDPPVVFSLAPRSSGPGGSLSHLGLRVSTPEALTAVRERLAAAGRYVIRYDHRDTGGSTTYPPGEPGYTSDALWRDPVAVLDHLGIERAHVVGASMGGMIAQVMAARYPARVLSLASIMSTTGSLRSGQPRLKAMAMLLKKPAPGRDAFIEFGTRMFTYIGSPGFERDDAHLRDMLARSYDRRGDPNGPARQLAAILANGKRCPNAALPGSRYCGLPPHQALTEQDTDYVVPPEEGPQSSDPALEEAPAAQEPEPRPIRPAPSPLRGEGRVRGRSSRVLRNAHGRARRGNRTLTLPSP